MFSTNQLQKIDVNSKEFKALPADMRHDILSEMKELRKQNSWRHINEMPDVRILFLKIIFSFLFYPSFIQLLFYPS